MRAAILFFVLWLVACGVVRDVEDATIGPGACCFAFGGDDAVRACLQRSLDMSGALDCTYAECLPSFNKVWVCTDGTTDEDAL